MDRVRELDASTLRSRSRSVDVTSLPFSRGPLTIEVSRSPSEVRRADLEEDGDPSDKSKKAEPSREALPLEEINLSQQDKEPSDNQLEENPRAKQQAYTELLRDFFKLSVRLENEGSVARDHMANERTFLSWIRTAMTFVTFGVAFLQFFRLEEKSNFDVEKDGIEYNIADKRVRLIHDLSRPIGAICILMGILATTFGAIRYFEVQQLLISNYFPATRMSIAILAVINLSVLVLLLVLDIKISVV